MVNYLNKIGLYFNAAYHVQLKLNNLYFKNIYKHYQLTSNCNIIFSHAQMNTLYATKNMLRCVCISYQILVIHVINKCLSHTCGVKVDCPCDKHKFNHTGNALSNTFGRKFF